MNAHATYQATLDRLIRTESALLIKKRIISWSRFAIVVITFLWWYNTWHLGWRTCLAGALIGLAIFLLLVAIDVNTRHALDTNQRLQKINHSEIATLNGDYSQRDGGAPFQNDTHAYSADLDIFGTHSLFQYTNRAQSFQGKNRLADWFSRASAPEVIAARQSAVSELSAQTEWRQYLEAYGTKTPLGTHLEAKIKAWTESKTDFTGAGWSWIVYIYPVLTLGSLYAYLDDAISLGVFSLCLIVFLVFSFAVSARINATYHNLDRLVKSLQTLQKQLEHIEQMQPGQSELLQSILQKLHFHAGTPASAAIGHLKTILNRFELRMNIYLFLILNPFLLWDVRQAIALYEWKKKYAHFLLQWIDALAEAEALSSLSTLAFNHPEWVFPKIAEDYFTLSGEEIGHPLITADKRVDNSFAIGGQGKIALITGSNMGGKSTFLRSLGVNAVLAYAGAPVCAKRFSISIARLMSSMRIADNLAENTSTFYAELKKLKAIIEAVNKGEKVFILLDEILRGTNSLDRHAGSQALMLQLIREKAVAVIATHDVELAALVKDYPLAIENYHFDVQVNAQNELYFDYRLKTGVCQRMNASILMQQIGIEL